MSENDIDRDAIIEGVRQAISDSLTRYYVNQLVCIAVEDATREWLDDNRDEILATIARAARP